MAFDYTIPIVLTVAFVLAIIIVLVIFQDRFGFNKGMRLGPYEFVLRCDPYYERRRKSVNDVSAIIFKDREALIETLEKEAAGPYLEAGVDEKEGLLMNLRKFNPNNLTHSNDFDIGAFVLSSLMGSKMLLFVMYRSINPITGAAKPFPSGHALAARKAVATSGGFLTRRLIEGQFYRFTKDTTWTFEGLGKMRVGYFIPDDDISAANIRPSVEKLLAVSSALYSALPSVQQYGALVKSLKEDSKRLTRLVKEYLQEINRLGGRARSADKTVEAISNMTKGSRRISSSMVPVLLYTAPIIGAAVFQYGFNSNPIFGVILGTTIAMMATLSKR